MPRENAMSKLAPIVLCLVLVGSVHAQTPAATQSTGQFDFTIRRIDIHPLATFQPNVRIGADMGFEIKNTGDVSVQVALVVPGPVVQVDGGFEFGIITGPNAVHGAAWCRFNTVSNCLMDYKDYSLIRPGRSLVASIEMQVYLGGRELGAVKWGRFGGTLFVREVESGKSWMERSRCRTCPS